MQEKEKASEVRAKNAGVRAGRRAKQAKNLPSLVSHFLLAITSLAILSTRLTVKQKKKDGCEQSMAYMYENS